MLLITDTCVNMLHKLLPEMFFSTEIKLKVQKPVKLAKHNLSISVCKPLHACANTIIVYGIARLSNAKSRCLK